MYPAPVRSPSVRRRRSPPHLFFSETTQPIKAKFYMKHLKEGETNVYIHVNRLNAGHMTKMVDMPLYGKHPSKIFSGTGGLISIKLIM